MAKQSTSAASSIKLSPKELKDMISIHESIENHLEAEVAHYKSIGDYQTASRKEAELISERQKLINELLVQQEKLTENQHAQRKLIEKQLNDLIPKQREAIENERRVNAELVKQKRNREAIIDILKDNIKLAKEGWKYLMESDKVIKNTILNLGMSGMKADLMRGSFEQSVGFVDRMGGSIEDVQKIMEGYADETGRARVLSAEMVKDITMIGKGTGLGIEQAIKLGAQFEFMGLSAKGTMDYVQGIVDTSERMGVNTTKVLKNLSDNFKKLNTFTFTRGSKAMAEMAMNAEKMKVDMSDAMNLAEATRGLDKVIELTANLQVMGGEFAKLDPFKALFMSRNEPEKWTEEISKMTRGLFTFKKNSKDVFEKFISPVDADRLRNVAKSLGIAEEKLFEIGQRRLDLDSMAKDMSAMGLTSKEKELVQGAAIFNEKSMKFQVMLGGHMRDISTLTADQARSFAKEQVTLEDRAKQAQTFDEVFKATIKEMKAALLPLLQTINQVLVWMRPVIIRFTEWISKGPAAWIKVVLLYGAVITGLKLATTGIEHVVQKFISGGAGIGRSAAGAVGGGGGGGGAILNPNAGKGLMRGGAGIGAAALGIGAGVGAAAGGISLLANAMSKLDEKQSKILLDIVKTLGWFVVGGTIAAVAIIGLGTAMGVAAPPMGAFALAALGIGAAVGIAAAGIGLMGMGLGKMLESAKGAGKDMFMIGAGIGAIAGGMSLLANPAGLIGMAAFAGVMGTVALAALATARVGDSFAQMGLAMKGTKDDWMAVEQAITSISKANFKGGGAITELANMLKKPLIVQFADKDVALNTYVTLDVNGEKFHQAIGTTAHVQLNQSRAKTMLETIFHR